MRLKNAERLLKLFTDAVSVPSCITLHNPSANAYAPTKQLAGAWKRTLGFARILSSRPAWNASTLAAAEQALSVLLRLECK
jgi:hypothetical protein